jgi:hypothetical protein
MTTTMLVLALALVGLALSRLPRSILIIATVATALGIAAIWTAAHPVNKHTHTPRWPLAYESRIA